MKIDFQEKTSLTHEEMLAYRVVAMALVHMGVEEFKITRDLFERTFDLDNCVTKIHTEITKRKGEEDVVFRLVRERVGEHATTH